MPPVNSASTRAERSRASGQQQLRRGLPVGHRELLGVLADQPPHPTGGIDERLGRRLGVPRLLDDRLPQLGEAEPVGVQDVRQRCALLGAAATGRARRGHVGRTVAGELGDHRLQVAPNRASKILEADDVTVAVELDLGQDALDDPVDEVGKSSGDQPRDLGDLRGEDHARAMRRVGARQAHRGVRSRAAPSMERLWSLAIAAGGNHPRSLRPCSRSYR
jgi:hypothetical protein